MLGNMPSDWWADKQHIALGMQILLVQLLDLADFGR